MACQENPIPTQDMSITLNGEQASPCERRRCFPLDVATVHSYVPGCGNNNTTRVGNVVSGEDRLIVPTHAVSQLSPWHHVVVGHTQVSRCVFFAHLGCDVVDAEQTLAEIGLVDAFVAGDEVSYRPKLNLSRCTFPNKVNSARRSTVVKASLKCNY